ncbi:carbohydrate kinase family protein [Promethearchaeum syntrophicum]|uniref:Carbohydrate kinase family protein n=1 Tax=Promethearchaeum syntrophicum TaxID=2594042 RepID=A0A5B9D708_9ARCH|nr:carbohydrate kinase family protein [Candidatus Prometheoarchaeum syntrophicum]QEE14842.1 putative sugar kinase [Candidatus Prometheoarchaeum syntrophicum]
MGNEFLGLGEVVVDWVSLIDHFPEPDEKIDSLRQYLFSGGVTANFTVAASRLGAKTGFFGAIGNDSYGDFLKSDFKNENVDYSYLITKNNKNTPVNFIFVVKNTGEKVIIQSPYMHSTIPKVSDLDEKIFENIKLLHTSAIYHDLTIKAIKLAKKNNIFISLDLEKQIAVRGLSKLRPILHQVDLLIPNKAGAMQLTDTKNPEEAAKKFLDLGVKTIVITLGDQGALIITKNKNVIIPALKVNPVDTTGAGDTFCAALCYSYVLKKFSIEKAALFANAAAALKIQNMGARTGMPTYEEVIQFLKKRNFKEFFN